MTPSETSQLLYRLQAAAKILKANTPYAEFKDFENLELAARQHMLETVGTAIGEREHLICAMSRYT